jgi:hypothetical protein
VYGIDKLLLQLGKDRVRRRVPPGIGVEGRGEDRAACGRTDTDGRSGSKEHPSGLHR